MATDKKSIDKQNTGSITVRQTRSGIARVPAFKATLQALGLGRIGKVSTLPANAAVLGMIKKVIAVVEVTKN